MGLSRKKAVLLGGLTAVLLAAWIPATAEAYINVMPSEVTVMQETEMYDSYEQPGKPVGSIGAVQSLHVVAVDKDWAADAEGEAKWLQVETWLGNKWIRKDERVGYGGILEESKELTLLSEASLYDRPDESAMTVYKIAPQRVQSTASLTVPIMHGFNTFSFSQDRPLWYRISTWLGDKWIVSPVVLEDIGEEAVSFAMKLSDTETAYTYPYRTIQPEEQIQLPEQVVQVIGRWDTHNQKGPWGETWYHIQLPEGERWIAPEHPVLTDYSYENETITLQTETRYYDDPILTAGEDRWLKPGEYRCYEKSGDWAHLILENSAVWVNLKRALLERPLGIEQTDETVNVTEETEYYDFPATDEMAQPKGFYAPQPVNVFEKWTAPDGQVWLHIHGLSDAWIKGD